MTAARGFVLVEALIAVAVCTLVLAGAVEGYLVAVRASLGNDARLQADELAIEGLEAARVLRDSGWNSYISTQPVGTPVYLLWSGTSWRTSANDQPIGVFHRSLTFTSVQRDSSGAIVTSGGTVDTNTKLVTVTVAWQENGATSTRTLSAYLTNLFAD